MSRNQLNVIVQPLLTDLYQITMAYAYWKSGKTEDTAVFDLYFRKNPFDGEFTVFAGLEEVLKFLESFRYSASDIEYLRGTLPSSIEPEFYEYLGQLTPKDVVLSAVQEGTVVFPKIPLISVQGPLIMVQLLETTLLTLVNYASLITTNAARYRVAAGPKTQLLEFGLRRAQGPDGGLSASKYCYVGGFDGTSNVLAGKLFGIPVRGTHAHSYITSFSSLDELNIVTVQHAITQQPVDLLKASTLHRIELSKLLNLSSEEANDGELAAMISFAVAFPANFLALIDTYDVHRSGLINFCAVGLALHDAGRRAVGIRLDSGDLAYLSNLARNTFTTVAKRYGIAWFAELNIVASNDINEDTILSLKEQSHEIDTMGIGTHLVTCQRQPALGCVYKMVEVNGNPTMKLSQELAKITIPGNKQAYRLYGSDSRALIDLVTLSDEIAPCVGQKVLCRHPFLENKRCQVSARRVEALYEVYWREGRVCRQLPALHEVRARVYSSMKTLRQDHKRHLNPTPYKVAVSERLYDFFHSLWLASAPIGELS